MFFLVDSICPKFRCGQSDFGSWVQILANQGLGLRFVNKPNVKASTQYSKQGKYGISIYVSTLPGGDETMLHSVHIVGRGRLAISGNPVPIC